MPDLIKHFKFLLSMSLLGFCLQLTAQRLEEVSPPASLRTLIFKSGQEDQFPIIKLGESIRLQFDDLRANEEDYYFKIIHCTAQWTPSDLLKSQYLDGLDNQRIIDHKNSYNTLVPYSHFNLVIPNENLRLKLSGNYMLQVFNTYDEIQFSRRFLVYEDLVGVQAAIKRSRTLAYLNSKQVLQFSVNTQNINLNQPAKELEIVLLKNYQWNTQISGIQPMFNNGNTLVYDYDQPTSFWSGNEYLNFDTKDMRAATAAIQEVRLEDIYEHYLYPNTPRNNKPYTYFPDVNGDFIPRTLQGALPEREGDYTWVHFSLKPNGKGNSETYIYVLGKFNNYTPSPEYLMTYNATQKMYQARILFKQGFYNYSYALSPVLYETGFSDTSLENETYLDENGIDGNFHFTENQYQILVYFKGFLDQHQRLVGIGSANSMNINDQ
ncbi:DUF5103 domain-containing protein [Flavobacteriaceae bacterium]|nr:DUF5103 domain-containing protein [Flavobacteriaceae bacterium]MDC1218674.1 DUF5103 domain-containing protein [Flavobacteriaceae bacterium]